MTRKARAEARRPPVFPACRSKTGCAGSPAAALGGRPGGGDSLRGLTTAAATAAAQPQSAARNAPTSRAPPVADLQRTLDNMELSLDLCAEMCPHCRKVHVFPGLSTAEAFVCQNAVSRSAGLDN